MHAARRHRTRLALRGLAAPQERLRPFRVRLHRCFVRGGDARLLAPAAHDGARVTREGEAQREQNALRGACRECSANVTRERLRARVGVGGAAGLERATHLLLEQREPRLCATSHGDRFAQRKHFALTGALGARGAAVALAREKRFERDNRLPPFRSPPFADDGRARCRLDAETIDAVKQRAKRESS